MAQPLTARLSAVEAEIATLKTRIQTQLDALVNGRMGDVAVAVPSPPARLKAVCNQRTLRAVPSKVMALSWAANASDFATVYQDGKLVLWNGLAETHRPAMNLKSHWPMTVCLDSSCGLSGFDRFDYECPYSTSCTVLFQGGSPSDCVWRGG